MAFGREAILFAGGVVLSPIVFKKDFRQNVRGLEGVGIGIMDFAA